MSLVQPAQRVPMDHPIRRIKAIADAELERLAPVFDEMYSGMGRPSLPPKVLLKACLLIALFTVRSERQFCERLDYDLMFRFFLDMGMDEPSFDATTFTKNKKRLLEADVARLFFEGVVRQAKDARLISAEHFTVDGTLIEAWASTKSFKKKGARDTKPPDDPGNPTVNFHGEKRGIKPSTLGADAGYDVQRFVDAVRERGVTPHIAQTRDKRCASRVDERTTRHPGYAVSQRKRKLVEEIFGWMKTVGGFRKTRYRVGGKPDSGRT